MPASLDPPIGGRAGLRLWVSGVVVATDIPAVVICAVNPTDVGFHHGVSGSVEQQDTDRWSPMGGFASSIDSWGGLGRIFGPGEPMTVPAIGIGAAAQSVGRGQYLGIAGLPPGRYRLSQRGSATPGTPRSRQTAFGEFVVNDESGPLVPIDLRNPAGALLGVGPPIVGPGGGRVEIKVQGTSTGVSSRDDRDAFLDGLAPTVAVQAWHNGRWAPHHETPLRSAPVPGFDTTWLYVDLPPAGPGPLRLQCTHATAGELARVVWVVEDLRDLRTA